MGKRQRNRERTTTVVSAKGYDRLADVTEARDPERAARFRLIARTRQVLARRRLGR